MDFTSQWLYTISEQLCISLIAGLVTSLITVGVLHSFQIFPGMFLTITALLLFQLSPESEKHLEFHKTPSEQLTHEYSQFKEKCLPRQSPFFLSFSAKYTVKHWALKIFPKCFQALGSKDVISGLWPTQWGLSAAARFVQRSRCSFAPSFVPRSHWGCHARNPGAAEGIRPCSPLSVLLLCQTRFLAQPMPELASIRGRTDPSSPHFSHLISVNLSSRHRFLLCCVSSL